MAKKKEATTPYNDELQNGVSLDAAKAEFHKALLYAQKIAQRNISDPASSQQRRGSSFSTYTKENILSWLKNPSTNAKNLRNASMYLYNASPLYRRLINYQANMWLWDYVLYPLGYDESKIKTNNLQKQYLAAAKKCEVWNLKNELGKAAVSAIREGIFFGVSWESGDSFFIQKINADYCDVEAIADGTYLYTVDMSQIKEEELGFYPPEFTKMWNAYKTDGVKKQFVPEEISWCLPFCTADGDDDAYSYILYVDIGAVMQYASYLNAAFFAVLAVLTVLVCLFGWKLGGYVEKAHESQKWFFQNVSHELKTPMMAVQGCAEGINTGVLEPVEASRVIIEENEQMSNLIEELLALSRLEAGQFKSDFHSTDVRELLYDCLRGTEHLAQQRNLRITPIFDDDPVTVSCDEIHLRRAFTNIITNALRYAKEKIIIECRQEKGKAVIRIRDDGEGIAPELLPHIFDRFFSTRKGGAGVGLALTKEIVSLHRGTVRASNDSGAVFEIIPPIG